MEIIIMLSVPTCVSHLIGLLTYGPLLKDRDWLQVLNSSISTGVDINCFDNSIIYFGNLPFISTHPFTFLFGKYHIDNIGIIPYWTKMHKILRQAHKEAIQQYYK